MPELRRRAVSVNVTVGCNQAHRGGREVHCDGDRSSLEPGGGLRDGPVSVWDLSGAMLSRQEKMQEAKRPGP